MPPRFVKGPAPVDGDVDSVLFAAVSSVARSGRFVSFSSRTPTAATMSSGGSRFVTSGVRSRVLERSRPSSARPRRPPPVSDLVSTPAKSGPSDPSRRNVRSSASRDIGLFTPDSALSTLSVDSQPSTPRMSATRPATTCPSRVAWYFIKRSLGFALAACSAGRLANISASYLATSLPHALFERFNLLTAAFFLASSLSMARSTLEKA
mmetsp:Transcript_1120/g.4283  ORF Transcript_1120/g.4283 Transcript_1120/m.4283 type:complete len:208 (+) Transcript_1120:372-995(+)